ncbi:amidohydrolase [Aerococcus sp. 150760007-1]|uniref:Amidohydrolase n=2 Tax=Aerococcus TaxID=1375 RepID=A0ABR5ZWR2_9LACT|nr:MULTISPECIES: amidohydrolase [Lactobacillales]KAF3300415.1 amidohydrolase [Carnobacterium sp. PL17RED31]KAF3300829.1 amidohydrolase [Carnobacterium sp. PL26RED25]KAF3305246.1 amidohydrolase [Carnobacterium sp. PL24RED07]MBA5746166.1 amidohydrolase [Aerococcus urinaeequi]MBA5828950.1 amidohydrolase [Aerococcus urinaeequi]
MLKADIASTSRIESEVSQATAALLAKWLKHAASIESDVVQVRRHLHKNPELSFEEVATANFVYMELLSAKIFDIDRNVGDGYGIVARVHGSKPGPTIALRADMDALPITEETDLPFASENTGAMHACGHDIHTATLLGVAQVIQAHRDEFAGTVVFIFQHAEEKKPGGAKAIVDAGYLAGVDAVFGLHIDPSKEAGTVGYSLGYGSAASDAFEIKIQGRGGHASSPHTAIDSVVIAAETIANLQTLVSRVSNPIEPLVVTVAGVDAGMGAPNIIADTATLVGTVRSSSPEGRVTIKNQFIQIAEMTAAMHGGSASVDYEEGYPAIQNTASIVTDLVAAIDYSAVFTDVIENTAATGAMMNGEDFAYYLEDTPGAFFTIGCDFLEKDKQGQASYPLHNSRFVANEACILNAMSLFLVTLSQYLKVVPHD